MLRTSELAAAIDAATVILQAHNDRAERISHWRAEVDRLAAIRDTKPAGVERHVANIRLGIAEFALLRLQMEEA